MRFTQSRRRLNAIALLVFGHLTLLIAFKRTDFDKSINRGNVRNTKKNYDSLQRNLEGKSERMEASAEFRNYDILSSSQIFGRLRDMERLYPNFFTLESSQETYGLQAAGGKDDCPFDHDVNLSGGCKNYIITIEDHVAHPKGSDSWKLLPEVFLSGALHGNERVGPTAVTELADVLLKSASCEAKPAGMEPKTNDESRAEWVLTMEEGRVCREELYNEGIDDASRKWLARLVNTRRTVIMPTPNALGYFRNERTERNIDPNRDFPYDLKDATTCMQTIAGRSINEVFRDHIFQLSLTFHGGMEVIAYEWGAPTYSNYLSPDDTAQKEISAGYSRFAGKFDGTPLYQTGTMNQKVYPVRGGMEDWAYAGSWDPERVIQCKPETFKKYPAEKTTYNDSTLRALNMLVETSDRKAPPSNSLGSNQQLFNDVNYRSNGHIARNIRLALLAIDLVQPYVTFVSVNGVSISDDMSLGVDSSKFDKKDKAVAIAHKQNNTVLEWTVGGGFTVDYTTILYTKWDASLEAMDAQKMSKEDVQRFTNAPATHGKTRWHKNSVDSQSDPVSNKDGYVAAANGPIFSVTIDTSKYNVGDTIAVFAMAKVDQGWSSKANGASPNLLPMSHVVNARTNPDWLHESAEKIVQGRTEWFSIPLTLVILKHEGGSQTKDLSNRFENLPGPSYWGQNMGQEEGEDKVWSWVTPTAAVTVMLIGVLLATKSIWRSKYKSEVTLDQVEFMYDDEGVQLQKTGL